MSVARASMAFCAKIAMPALMAVNGACALEAGGASV
jgi:hypothetical protein